MVSPHTYKIRNYRPSDFDAYVNLHIETEHIDQAGRCTSRQVLREDLQRPGCDPEKDLFLAEAAGKIVGFLNITPELVTRRVLLYCLVHPEHRRKGLAKRLLEPATRRARELQTKVMHVSVSEENAYGREILSRLGFVEVRQLLEMSLPLGKLELPDTANSKFTVRHLQHGEEAGLAEVQNRCFADTWGFNPNTPEEIAYSLSLSGASAKDVVILYDDERPVGYCWTKISCAHSAETGQKKGRILMLGVDPDYRGRGIGRMALRAGLSYLKDKGVAVVELTVDSENPAAYSLYESSGFRVLTRSLYYEKPVD
jgi:mycothiol synthase